MAKAVALPAIAMLAACSDGDSVPDGNPLENVKQGTRGYEARPGVMFAVNDQAYWAEQALAGFETTSADTDFPGALTRVYADRGCDFRAPTEGEYVANVHVGGGAMETPLYAWDDREMVARARKWVDIYKQRGEEPPISFHDGDRYNAVDVVVTETGKPVYLVLQHEFGKVLWNIQTAPGVEIAYIAAIGLGDVAVANVGADVPMKFVTLRGAQGCKAVPARKPADHWRFVEQVRKDGSARMTRILRENEDRYYAYSRWLRETFGVGSEENLVGAERVAQVLVGPMPADLEHRVAFRPISGATVHVTSRDRIMATSESSYREKHDAMLRAIAVEAAGGDLTALAPRS